MYEQSLYRVIEPIKINTIKRLNKAKKWKYGYDKDHDVVVISKTGQIGDVYRSEAHTTELPSRQYLVSRLLLEKNKQQRQ